MKLIDAHVVSWTKISAFRSTKMHGLFVRKSINGSKTRVVSIENDKKNFQWVDKVDIVTDPYVRHIVLLIFSKNIYLPPL
jgi:hypothetical protein